MEKQEYGQRIQYFQTLKRNMLAFAEEYLQRFQELNDSADALTCRKEYGRGGLTIHRGFYSPSMTDIVTGGCNRGKLLKQTPTRRAPDYIYHFDERDRLLRVLRNEGNTESVEFLIYSQHRIRSLIFQKWNGQAILHFLSDCVYDEKDRLVTYTTALYNYGSITDMTEETFVYDAKDRIEFFTVEGLSFLNGPVQKDIYTMIYDQSGKLEAYTADPCNGREPRTYLIQT